MPPAGVRLRADSSYCTQRASIACFISLSWVDTLGADVLATAFFLLLPAVVSCGAGAAKAPATSANANAKAIACFISPPESFEDGQSAKILVRLLLCSHAGFGETADAICGLLKIDEYLVNPE
jgi:hypothetical protein